MFFVFFTRSSFAFDLAIYVIPKQDHVKEDVPISHRFLEFKKERVVVDSDGILTKFLQNTVEFEDTYFKEKAFFGKELNKKVEFNFNSTYAMKKVEDMQIEVVVNEKGSFLQSNRMRKKQSKKEFLFFAERYFNYEVEQKDFFDKVIAEVVKEKTFVAIEDEIEVEKGNVSFSQSILPVRFVYIDVNGEVVKIWNNVRKGDDVYVLKFFSFEENEELDFNSELFRIYSNVLKNLDIFAQEYIYDISNFMGLENQQNGMEITLEYTIGKMHEVHTYI
jgi:hypothetical protein